MTYPSDIDLITSSFLVWTFSFRYKQWRQYHVNDLIDISFDKKGFDRLVIREDYKHVLEAMVAQPLTSGQKVSDDVVPGKGQGLNILLHGMKASPILSIGAEIIRSAWSG